MDSGKNILNALFDFSFSTFITTKLIRILYALAIVAAAFAALGIIVSGFTQGFFSGLVACVVAVVAFFIYVIVSRLWLELILVIFRISDNVSAIAATKSPSSGAAPRPPTDEGGAV